MDQFLERLDLQNLKSSMIGNDSDYDEEEPAASILNTDGQSVAQTNNPGAPQNGLPSESGKAENDKESVHSHEVAPTGI